MRVRREGPRVFSKERLQIYEGLMVNTVYLGIRGPSRSDTPFPVDLRMGAENEPPTGVNWYDIRNQSVV